MGDIAAGFKNHAGGFVAENDGSFALAVHLMQLGMADARGKLLHHNLIGAGIRQFQRLNAQDRRIYWQNNNACGVPITISSK